MDLQDKRVLVTGGSSGIGLAITRAMLAKGAHVVITGRNADRLKQAENSLRANGAWAKGVQADIATAAGRVLSLEKSVELLGGLDILVNNAGGVRGGRLENTTEQEIRTMIEVDLVAPILLTQAALVPLRASGNGLIVNVTSGVALIGFPFYATYSAAKAGLARFGEAMRRELKGEGVHVLTLYPGSTDTPMMHTCKAGPELGFNREPADAVADALIAGIEADSFDVIRYGENGEEIVALNQQQPATLDDNFSSIKQTLEDAVSGHSAL